jgi:hypothetical protein
VFPGATSQGDDFPIVAGQAHWTDEPRRDEPRRDEPPGLPWPSAAERSYEATSGAPLPRNRQSVLNPGGGWMDSSSKKDESGLLLRRNIRRTPMVSLSAFLA